jgi:septal ring factor EnvC (AmiA/AmiB activator)
MNKQGVLSFVLLGSSLVLVVLSVISVALNREYKKVTESSIEDLQEALEEERTKSQNLNDSLWEANQDLEKLNSDLEVAKSKAQAKEDELESRELDFDFANDVTWWLARQSEKEFIAICNDWNNRKEEIIPELPSLEESAGEVDFDPLIFAEVMDERCGTNL